MSTFFIWIIRVGKKDNKIIQRKEFLSTFDIENAFWSSGTNRSNANNRKPKINAPIVYKFVNIPSLNTDWPPRELKPCQLFI